MLAAFSIEFYVRSYDINEASERLMKTSGNVTASFCRTLLAALRDTNKRIEKDPH